MAVRVAESKNGSSRRWHWFLEFFWIITGQFLAALGAVVMVRVLTEYLDPEQYGGLALILTVSGLITQVAIGGINIGIIRFYSVAIEKNDLPGYLRGSGELLSYAIFSAMLIGAVLMITANIYGYRNLDGTIAAIAIFAIVSGANGLLDGVQNAARQRRIVALHSAANAWLKIILSVMAIIWLGTNSKSAIVGYIAAVILVMVSQVYFTYKLFERCCRNKIVKSNYGWTNEIWRFSWPFSVWGIFASVQQASDRWGLEIFTSTKQVGQYAAAFQLGYSPVVMLTMLVMTMLGPILYQVSGDGSDSDRNSSVYNIIRSATIVTLLFTFLAFLVTWLLRDSIYSLMVAAPYRTTSYLLPWLVVSAGLFASGQVLSLKITADLRTDALLRLNIVTSIIGIGTKFLGAWALGVVGVVIGTLLYSSIYIIWMWVLTFPSDFDLQARRSVRA